MEPHQNAAMGERAIFYGLLGAALAWFVARAVYVWPFTVDDAYISARYARNLAEHFSLAWNPGLPPTEGYTNFLLVVVLAFAARLGLPIIVAAKTLGVLSGAALIVLLALAGGRAIRHRWAALAAALLLAAQPALPVHAVSGLETLPYALLLFCLVERSVAMVQSAWVSPRAIGFLSLLGLATALMRPEGACVAAILILAIAAVRRGDLHRSHWLAILFCFILPGVAYMAWRVAYFGYWLPNSFYRKVGSALPHVANVQYFRDFANGIVTLLPILLIALGFRRRAVFLAPLTAIAAASAIYLISDVANMGYLGRFLFPCLPLILWMFAAALGEILAARQAAAPLRFVERLAIAGLLAVMLAQTGAQTSGYQRWARQYGFGLRRAHIAIGQLLRGVSPTGRLAVWSDAGAVPFFSQWTALDIGGLVDSHINHFGFTAEDFYRFHPDALVVTIQPASPGDTGEAVKLGVLTRDPRWSEYERLGAFAFDDRYFQAVYGRRGALGGRLAQTIRTAPGNIDAATTHTVSRAAPAKI